MISADGSPKVIEYNCRFGDPETQPIMMRLKSDLVALCNSALDKNLDQATIDWDPQAALGVVLAAGGYPADYAKGDVISGIPAATEESKVFHAGTADKEGQTVTSGGRVLCAVGLGRTVSEAQSKAYKLVDKISWNGMYFRKDIGHRAISREKT